MDDRREEGDEVVASAEDGRGPAWVNALGLLIWLVAGVVAFLPFGLDTSPWDAVTLRVPGNQGNWWHFLAGAPFFLAYPMIWLRVRSLFAAQSSTVAGRRLIWSVVGVSIGGTVLVELPFLLHLAGTSDWQRLSVLSVGFGIMVASALLLFLRRHSVLPTQACVIGLNTAYLANVALCLVVYCGAAGGPWSRSGWLVSVVLVWPIALDLVWLLLQTSRTRAPQRNFRVV